MPASARQLIIWMLSRFSRESELSILMYHSVNHHSKTYFNVHPKEFSTHLQILSDLGANFVTMDAVAAYIKGNKRLPRRSVCLTFDDGYLDNLTEALPAAEQHGAPLCIYITTDYIASQRLVHGMPMINKELLRDYAAHPLLEFGGHTTTHPNLTQIPLTEVRNEIRTGKTTLEDWINKSVRHFAYPRGYYNQDVIQAVVESNFETAVTVVPDRIRPCSDPFRLGRIPVDRSLPGWLFEAVTRNGFANYSHIRGWV